MIQRIFLALASMTVGVCAAGAVLAQQSPSPPGFIAAADYSNAANWLCWPGRADACKVDLSTTVVSPGGGMRLEEYRPARREPPIDCFYVYPTVSLDPTPLSDLIPGPEERNVVASQFARFGQVCRTFAPMYRQLTLTALRERMAGGAGIPARPPGSDTGGPGGGYNDVLNAWNYYLATENKGRGVVLIGHSQGTAHLIRLMQEQIDGRPVQKQLVGAILLGGSVQVPAGAEMGGTFKEIPVCSAKRQSGCIVTYSSFRDNVPPPANSLFGRNGAGTQAACVNPANLRTGTGQPDSYFAAARPNDPRTGVQQGWVNPFEPIGTPFVKAPGFVTTSCVNEGGFSYLKVHVNGEPRDKRTDTLTGDVMQGDKINASWGLHLIDVNLSMGNLVDLVGRQGRSWRPAK